MRHPDTVTVGAAHRSAARAWGARPVPFRTRKLSPIAPRVLRGQPVGGQGAADRWTAPSRAPELKKGEASRPPPFLRFDAQHFFVAVILALVCRIFCERATIS